MLRKNKNHRRCISCNRIADRQQFWRIIRNYPEHQITLDNGMGRSAYICPQAQCLNLAQKKKRLSRVLKAQIPPEIYQQLWQRLTD
ncbi:MAG: YlxR family protein [Cyanobacteria bacterium]|nr:YlxR family protein [Cyanobacteria bacterium CG_2015-16_32_12]NCO79195.1 YlxR family protein [Cyanobacteria bacterium CG_2015-22_32_23]NCQ04937.1 YlxR family protein [Cyanobacteria bacterium CG_2015-09_32_10]NCQ41274.1 YlxR family protein [Cyanobacteria bacterium CG_2015-04_32_10]NCS84684.1 YlxR family protein [Cyanobacteria bacterium CG_2015-02_32_10]